MSGQPKSFHLSGAVHEYLVAHGTPPDALQRQLIEETRALGGISIMQIAPEQGAFMTLLTRLIGVRHAVEVGTFTGYSALAVALALPPEGRVIACDISPAYLDFARRECAQAENVVFKRITSRDLSFLADESIGVNLVDQNFGGSRRTATGRCVDDAEGVEECVDDIHHQEEKRGRREQRENNGPEALQGRRAVDGRRFDQGTGNRLQASQEEEKVVADLLPGGGDDDEDHSIRAVEGMVPVVSEAA